MKLTLAVVMPAYNEQDCIEDVVKQWTTYLDTHFPNEAKLIVINDGSKDNTGAILAQLAPQYPTLYAVNQPNGGHGNAVVNGYQLAVDLEAEYIFQTDSDDQFITDDFMKLWAKKDQSDFILGFRQHRFDAPFRLFVTQILRYSLFFIYGTLIQDSNIPFRLIKGSFMKRLLSQLPEPFPFAPNIFLAVMARKSGQNLFNIPITHKSRMTGEVSIQKMKLLKVCWQSFQELASFRLTLNERIRNL